MKTIAIIEDDQTIGDLLEEVLQKEGFQVKRAYSGTEAVYLLSQQRPDLALLDLMLPGLSGEEVLPHLAGVPVIVVSAKVGVDDTEYSLKQHVSNLRKKLREAGGKEYIQAVWGIGFRLDGDGAGKS